MTHLPLRRVGLLLVVFTLFSGSAARAAGGPAGFVPFAPDSVWNLPLRDDAPISPNSAKYVSYLRKTVAANGSWVNSYSCGMPEYWADANTPTVSVTLDHPSYEDPAMIQAWSAVPIPSDAQPANCGDKNFAVLQTQPDGSIKEWEFWKASQSSSGQWSAEWGGAITNVLTDRGEASTLEWKDPTAANPAARTSSNYWNVTASGISMIAGVITNSDLASGSINHALAMAVTAAAQKKWMWPAQRSDGYSTNPDAIPEGAHLRLNPAININSLNLTPLVKMIAEAAQKYGIIVRDQTASADVFYTEPPAPGQTSPIYSLLNGESLGTAMKAFPWGDLEVLDSPTCASYKGCSVTNNVTISVPADPVVGVPLTLDTSNSTLNYPRTDVRWDLSGTGDYTTDAGTSVTQTYLPTQAGHQTVSVQITTANGSITTGTATFTVAPVVSIAPATSVTTEPTTTSESAKAAPDGAEILAWMEWVAWVEATEDSGKGTSKHKATTAAKTKTQPKTRKHRSKGTRSRLSS